VKKRHIALVGFMAAGKTTIGRLLARELELPFVDTDERIVARHGPVADIFARDGEAGFRTAECDAIRAVLEEEPAVIALGGGAITHAPTREVVRAGAITVYLELPVEELVARLRRSKTVRPVVGAEPTIETVAPILAAREPLYREATLTVPGPHPTRDDYAIEIARRLREAGYA